MLAVILLIGGAVLRFHELPQLLPGLSDAEIIEIRVAEAVRGGQIGVYYDLGDEGREGLYHIAVAALTSLIGRGTIGYRVVSIGAGMVALAMVYAIGARLYGRLAGLTALALMSVGMYPVLLSRQITPETLLPGLTGIVLLSLITALPVYRRRRLRGANTTLFAALGVFLGMGLYAHPAGLLLTLIAAVFVVYVNRYADTTMSTRRNRYVRFALLLLLITSIPYLTSSVRQPDLNGLSRLFDSQAFNLENVVETVLGVFVSGDDNVAHNLPGRPLIDPVSALLLVYGLWYLVRRWRRPRYAILPLTLLLLSPVIFFGADGASFGTYAIALPVVYVLVGFGASLFIYKLPQRAQLAGFAGLLLLVGFNLVWTINSMFNTWAEMPEVTQAYNGDIGHLAYYVDTHSELPTVICGWSPEQSPGAAELTNAQLIELMRNRRDANIRYVDCDSGLVLTDGGTTQRVVMPDPAVLESTHPQVLRWLEQGEFIDDAAVPAGTVMTLNVEAALADQLGAFTVTTPITYAPETGNTESFGPPVSFGGNLTFLGYASDDEGDYMPGSIVTLVTYWRVDGLVPPDLRQFTHVLADPGASPVANTDTLSVQARLLQSRDILVQVTYVRLPETLPQGEYSVSVGAYQDTSQLRLDVLADGQPNGTRIFLYAIEVNAEQPAG